MALRDGLRRAAECLKRRAWDEALEHLQAATRPEDPPGDVVRGHAFRAQALEGLGRLHDAERAAAAAVRGAKTEPGQAGLSAVRALHAQILTRLAGVEAAQKARVADLDLASADDDALAARENGPAWLIRKANVLADLGRGEEARVAATRAWVTGGSARDQVLAALTLARCPGEETAGAWIERAHQAADAANDENLLTAVAKAARAASVTLRLIG